MIGEMMGRRLFELILAVKRKCQGNEEQIQGELGLSQAQFHGLIVLDEEQEITGLEFAERMALSPSRGSRVLNTLVVDGYVKTRARPGDRRSIVAALTSRGRRTKQRIARGMQACESRVRRSLDRERFGRVMHALELLEATL
jgi:DNA-binding MarR family transcriptional regulator